VTREPYPFVNTGHRKGRVDTLKVQAPEPTVADNGRRWPTMTDYGRTAEEVETYNIYLYTNCFKAIIMSFS
jgi:hypothetical protein